jgi:hypothetical protein
MARTTRSTFSALLIVTGLIALAGCGGGHKTAAQSPSSTPSATPSTTPAPLVVRTCPLTGRPPTKNEKVNRVPLAVKIDNVSFARPQAGIDHADVVVEETVEGGLTRLMAIFQCDSATTVGPIRSARTSDADLLRLFNGGAVLGYSGSNSHVAATLATQSGAALISWDHTPGYFHVDPSRPAVHNVMGSTDTIRRAGLAHNKKLRAPRPIFAYGQPKIAGTPAKHAAITWSSSASAAWAWNGHKWLRTQNGTADVLADGQRVKANNVVIMSITVANTGLHDVLGNPSPDDVVTGSGRVWLLRDGRVIRGTWNRPNPAHKMVLKDKHGRVLPLTPGNTWIELLPRPRTPSLS